MTSTHRTAIPPGDLKREAAEIGSDVQAAITRVTGRGWFLVGPELEAFEREFAAWVDAPYAVGVHSGTDALMLALAALDIGEGDEVVIPAMTSVATATAVLRAGAEPVLADVDPVSMNLDPDSTRAAVTPRTKAIVPVHLYGRPAPMDELLSLSRDRGLVVVEDACQAHGAQIGGRMVGTLAEAGCFSFYPSKNLGAYGDGGMVVTSDSAVDERLRLLRQYGWRDRDRSEVLGWNSRLDELQSAVLRAKLPYLAAWNARRAGIAQRYTAGLSGVPGLTLPAATPGQVHHLYVVRVRDRDGVRTRMTERGIGSGVHYPLPIHRHPALASRYKSLHFPNAEEIAATALSLPLFPQLTNEEVDAVIAAVRAELAP